MDETQLDDSAISAFRETGDAMRWVGIFWVILGALVAAGALVSLALLIHLKATGQSTATSVLTPLLALLDQAMLIGAGVYTFLTARTLRQMVTDRTNVIPTMMVVFGQLRRLFTFYMLTIGLDLATDLIKLAKG